MKPVKKESPNDGVGLTWDDGKPLTTSEGKAWWAGWEEGNEDGRADMEEEMRDEIERLRDALFAVAARDLQSLAQGALEGSEEDRIAALKIIALYDMQKIAIQALEKTK